jgi:HPt (histidine-containing phosphotransfer) domain-containing protein
MNENDPQPCLELSTFVEPTQVKGAMTCLGNLARTLTMMVLHACRLSFIATKADRGSSMEAGMDDLVSKSVEANGLRVAVVGTQSAGENAEKDRISKRANAVLDEAALLARVDGDREFLKELIELFIADCPNQLAAILDAIARGDADGLRRASHSLRGSVSNFFAPASVEAALRLETRGRTGDLAGVEEEFGHLENVIGELCTALDSSIEESKLGIFVLARWHERIGGPERAN